jgi:hypothetical protein
MPKFYVGQPVICVDGDFEVVSRRYPGCTWPRLGHRYVIRAYVLEYSHFPAVVLREIENPLVRYRDGVLREAGFWDERFEPATRKEVSSIIEEAHKLGPWTGGTHWDKKVSEREDA